MQHFNNNSGPAPNNNNNNNSSMYFNNYPPPQPSTSMLQQQQEQWQLYNQQLQQHYQQQQQQQSNDQWNSYQQAAAAVAQHQLQQQQQQQSQHLPPEDPEIRSIIDKLASFVARNGPEFENVTKQKQKDNAKFSFLFGGEHYGYYLQRLGAEKETAIRQQQQQQHQQQQQQQAPAYFGNQPHQMMDFSQPPPLPTTTTTSTMSGAAPPPPPLPPVAHHHAPPTIKTDQIAMLHTSIATFRDQIQQSEKNLSAQHDAFKRKKKMQFDEAIRLHRIDLLGKMINESRLDLGALEPLVSRIEATCTKEAISNARHFVFNRNLINDKQFEAVCFYLLSRITGKDMSCSAQLHIVYFINEIIHYGVQHGLDIAKRNVDKVIIPCFCYTFEKANDEIRPKLNKLINIWEQSKYFSPFVFERLKNPADGIKYYEDIFRNENKELVGAIEFELDRQFSQLEQQHTEYVNHSNREIAGLQVQLKQSIMQQTMSVPPPGQQQQQDQQQQNQLHHDMSVPPPLPQSSQASGGQFNYPPPSASTSNGAAAQTGTPAPSNTPPGNQPMPLMSLMSLNPFDSMVASASQGQPSGNNNNSSNSTLPNLMSTPPPPPQAQHIMQQQQQQQVTPAPNFNVPPPPVIGMHAALMSMPPQPLMTTAAPPPINLNVPPPMLMLNPMQPGPAALQSGQIDISKPPPGFGLPPPPLPTSNTTGPPTKPMPTRQDGNYLPYYNWPAALIVPLVKPESIWFAPIDPKDVVLPAPTLPSDKLIEIMERFYNPSPAERNRNAEGWHKTALCEFYKAKFKARAQAKADRLVQREKKRELKLQQKKSPREHKPRRSSRSKSRSLERKNSVNNEEQPTLRHATATVTDTAATPNASISTTTAGSATTPAATAAAKRGGARSQSYDSVSDRSSRSSRSRSRSKSKGSRSSSSRSNSSGSSSSRSRSRRSSSSSSRSKSSRRSSRSSKSRSRSHSRSRSRRERGRSHSKSRSRSRSSSGGRTRSRSRTRQASPGLLSSARAATSSSAAALATSRRRSSRSVTPPLMGSVGATAAAAASLDQRLSSSNKGHQLLQKMGWSGSAGLGRHEQGIYNPIEGGEVRDKSDQYRGIGVSTRSDPFEQFRKNKSQGYIQRLRTKEDPRDPRKPNTSKEYDY